MHLLKLRKAAALAISALLLPIAAPLPEKQVTAAAAADEYHDDWLHVNDKAQIVDMDGNPVWLTGCNWFGYNVGSQVFDGVWSINMHQALNEIADHGFNFLRVPMSTQILLQWKNSEPDPIIKINEWKNPELTVEGIEGGTPKYSFDIWNQAVEWCRENGIKIMIDIHCATTNAAGHNFPLWYDDTYSKDDWEEALTWFADYYKDDDTILAIDLKNEPHGKRDEGTFAKWDNSTDSNNWKYAAEECAGKILDVNPNLLIMVEGIEVYPKFDKGYDWNSPSTDYAHYGEDEYQPYYGAWWGGNFRGAKDYPIDLGEHQSQLVYSPHDYGPLVYAQNWFHLEGEAPNFTSYEFDRESLLKEYWYDTWAFIVEKNIAPMLMGEWGGRIDSENDPSGANKQWMQILRDYMIEKRISHTFWCFNENSSDTGGLIAENCNWDHWEEEKYEFVKPALWQDKNGKFVSLDHKIPLGQNGTGITVSDYYANGNILYDDGGNTPTTTAPVSDVTTTTTSAVTETTTLPINDTIYGDANGDDIVSVADPTLIMQAAANPNDFEVVNTKAADVAGGNDGVTVSDALAIQKFLADPTIVLPMA